MILLALVLLQSKQPDSVAARVRQLADSYLVAYFERHPDEATLDGVANGPEDRLPDNSPASLARWQQGEDAWLEQLKRIDAGRLTGRPEAVAYGIMRDAIEGSIATRVCRYELWSIAHTGGGWLATLTSLAALQRVGTDEARRQTLARWRAVPAYIATELANHREGLRREYTAPRGNVEIALREIDSLLATPTPQSPLYDPGRRDSMPEFRGELARVIDSAITPAIREYRVVLARDYLNQARLKIGVSANPQGYDCYQASIRATTGLTVNPDTIHNLGEIMVEALETEMEVVAPQALEDACHVTRPDRPRRHDLHLCFERL